MAPPTHTVSDRQRRSLPDPQVHRSAGTRFLIAVLVVLVILFALVVWTRYHRSVQPPAAPMHQNSSLIRGNAVV